MTIPEKAEDVEEEEDNHTSELRVEKPAKETAEVSSSKQPSRRLSATGNRVTSAIRRASSGGDSASADENFLTVPQTVTASSSAETLTGNYSLETNTAFMLLLHPDNTLTGPPTPTSISVTLIPSSPSTSVAPSDLGDSSSVTYSNEGQSTMSSVLTMNPSSGRKKSAEGRELFKPMHKPPCIDEQSSVCMFLLGSKPL